MTLYLIGAVAFACICASLVYSGIHRVIQQYSGTPVTAVIVTKGRNPENNTCFSKLGNCSAPYRYSLDQSGVTNDGSSPGKLSYLFVDSSTVYDIGQSLTVVVNDSVETNTEIDRYATIKGSSSDVATDLGGSLITALLTGAIAGLFIWGIITRRHIGDTWSKASKSK